PPREMRRDRQLNLLRDMRSFSLISVDEFDRVASIISPVRTDLAQPPLIAPEFALYAREQAEQILDSLGLDGARLISRGGLRITTTLDLELYYQSECILRGHIDQLNGRPASATQTVTAQSCSGVAYLEPVLNINRRSLPNEGAIIVQDVATGEIRAMIGDAISYDKQPGPTIYPFVYLTGFRSGNYTPSQMVLDIPRQFPGATDGSIYTPLNPDGRFNGPLNLRDAMASYLRVPAIEVANRQGLSDLLDITQIFGLNSLIDVNLYDLSLIDRGGNVSLLDMTYANSVFASLGRLQGVDLPPIAQGYRARNPVAVLRIEAPDGTILWDYDADMVAISSTIIAAPEVAYLVNDILVDSGTRQSVLGLSDDALSIGRPVAVTNGTTGDMTDSWTIGYTPQLVVGVHVGRDDNDSMSIDNYGLQGAAPIWQAISRLAHDRYNYSPTVWTRPDDIIQLDVCSISGLLPPEDSSCPRRTEIFYNRLLPSQEDIYWQTVEVNSQTGQLASSFTPEFLIVEQQYFIPPESALEWWRTNNLPLPPTDVDTSSVPELLSETQILSPLDADYVRGTVDIRGRVDTENLQSFQVRYGAGIRPTQWIIIEDLQTSYTEGVSLGAWNTSDLNGPYTVQISVLYNDGSVDSAGISVTVDNVPPTLDLRAGDNNQVLYRWPAESVIPLQANADDNLAIDRVEFYNNGILIGEATQAPYEWIYTIERTGIEIFTATVFDEAGNQATSNLEVEVLRSGASGE
ncbi:MAG: Ig-like domain-containing protein, partial [Chloroflexota bacterium]